MANNPDIQLALLARAYATVSISDMPAFERGPGGPSGGIGCQGGRQAPCLRTSDICFQGKQLDTGNPMGGVQNGLGDSIATNQLYNMGKTICINTKVGASVNNTAGVAGQSDCDNMMGQKVGTGCFAGMRGGGQRGGQQGPGGMGPGGRGFAFEDDFAGPNMGMMRPPGQNFMRAQNGGRQGGNTGGTGLCGGNFRRIRLQCMGRNGQFMNVTGLVDSGTPVCLTSNQIAQMLGVGGGGGQRGGQGGGGGMFQITMKIDPNPNPITVPAVIDDRGQGTTFLPVPTGYMAERVDIELKPNESIFTEVGNPNNRVVYDCMSNTISGGMNPQAPGAAAQMGMMQRQGRGFAGQQMVQVNGMDVNAMNQMKMNMMQKKMMMNNQMNMMMAQGQGMMDLKDILVMGMMQQMRKEEAMMRQMMLQKELMDLRKPIPGQDTGSA